MSVSQGQTLAALMPIATIPKALATVHVNLLHWEWKRMWGWALLLRILSKRGGFSNLELSDKTKTTFIISRTVCKGGLPMHCCFYSCWCVYIYIYIFFFNDNLFLVICVFFCSDINECVRGVYKCSSDAFCNNTKGSYNCTCKPGFTGNGKECKGKRWGRNVEENQLAKSLRENFDTLAIALLFFWALQPLYVSKALFRGLL